MRMKLGTRRLMVMLLGALTLLPGGCTRRFFRTRTDQEVEGLFKQKDKYDDWKIEQMHVYPDPRARFADWTNPDRPPKPPDDPAAYDLSPNPQKGKLVGIKYIEGENYLDLMARWDMENRKRKAEEAAKAPPRDVADVEKMVGEDKTPAELEREIDAKIEAELAQGLAAAPPADYVPLHPFLLTLDQTVELGFFNSRDFQSVRENLYLSALPVTLERFSFAAQPFLFGNIIRQSQGGLSTDPGPSNGWAANTAAGVTKLFPTGALLLFNLANSTVYNLGSGLSTSSVTTVSGDLVQPLLAGGGWAVALEPLTQAERNLLYAIRDYMRLRQQYFVFFAAGQPTFIPGVQPGVPAISPTTVTQPAPFIPAAAALPVVANNPADPPQVVPGTGGRLFPVPGFAPTPQGYLSTIGERGQLVNAYKNIANLERYLRLFRVYQEGGIVNAVQVGQIEQQLLRSLESVLSNQAAYRVSLDQLKQQVGLPMSVVIDLDDEPLRPMIDIARRFEDVTRDFEDATNTSLSYGRMADAAQVRARLRRLFQSAGIVRDTRFLEQILRRWSNWEKLAEGTEGKPGPFERKLEELRAEREKLRQKITPKADPLADPDVLRMTELDFEIELARFERSLRIYEREPWKKVVNPLDQVALQNRLFRVVQRSFLNLLEEPFQERLEKIRKSWPDLPPVCVEGVDLMRAPEEQALEVVQRASLRQRLDLMNVRGQLVDAWRKIRVTANSLLGVLNVDYHIDASSPLGGARPFDIGGSTTSHQLIFNWQLPLVRIVQRNNYRGCLINYQQARRSLMNQEDTVVFNVRLELRNLRQTAQNYEQIQKRQIELAYLQVDQALQAFSQPQAPPGPAAVPNLVGPTAPAPQVGDPAALTTQLLTTQNSLLSAQNDLYSTWIGFLTGRMNFYRDLGIMPLDSRGVWIDDVARCECADPSLARNHGPGTGNAQQQPAGPLPEPRALPPAEAGPLEPGR
jgi:hypothetical protein